MFDSLRVMESNLTTMSADPMSAPRGPVGVAEGSVVSLPGGRTITLEQLQKMRSGAALIPEDEVVFLGSPEILLKSPRAGAHYGWPIRNSRTQGLCRSKVYRVVGQDELKDDTPYAVNTQKGVAGSQGQVEWYNHILVEINDEFYQRHFVAPLWRGTEQLARLRERLATKAEQIGLTITPEVTATSVTA